MLGQQQQDYAGEYESPGGFTFGIQGWTWGEQRPTSITFFINGTTEVRDQYGRVVKGVVTPDGKPAYFNRMTHAQVVEALAAEKVDVIAEMNKFGQPCQRCRGTGMEGEKACGVCYHKPSAKGTGLVKCVTVAGWPQLPYDTLKKLKELPPTPEKELRKIKDDQMRRDALKIRREYDTKVELEMAQTAEEDERLIKQE